MKESVRIQSWIKYADSTGILFITGNTFKVTAGGRTTTFVDDQYGRPRRFIDPVEKSGITEYDELNRVTSYLDRKGHTTKYHHGPVFLDSITDAKGQTYHFQRNALGWVYGEVDPLDQTTWHGYDRAGLRTRNHESARAVHPVRP